MCAGLLLLPRVETHSSALKFQFNVASVYRCVGVAEVDLKLHRGASSSSCCDAKALGYDCKHHVVEDREAIVVRLHWVPASGCGGFGGVAQRVYSGEQNQGSPRLKKQTATFACLSTEGHFRQLFSRKCPL